KLKELQELFWTEAEKYNVLPIDNSKLERFDVSLRPSLTRGRDEFTYHTGMDKLTPGAHTIIYDFKQDSPGLGKGGVGTIQVDGKTVATGRIERTLAF